MLVPLPFRRGCRRYPRRHPSQPVPTADFDDEALGGLAASIEALGVLQPLLVRPADHGTYHLIAGERRWRRHAAPD